MIAPLVAFIFSPLGKIALIAMGLFAAVAFIDRRATYRERARCQAAVIQSKLDAAQADLDAARQAQQDDAKNIDEITGQKTSAEIENAKLKDIVAKLPLAQQCIIPADRRLR